MLMLPLNQRRRQRGLSLVEAMVGITVGLIVVAGATLLVTAQITEHRRLMMETQVQQDLRAAGDLILTELRRAGTWEQANNSVWAPGAAAPASNPYSNLTPAAAGDSTTITYQVTAAGRGVSPAEDNMVSAAEERSFFLSGTTLYYRLTADADVAAQPLTDPNSLKITDFKVKLLVQSVPLDSFCNVPCAAGTCPVQEVRRIVVSITGESVSKPVVVRNVEVSTRLRNDRIVGSCA